MRTSASINLYFTGRATSVVPGQIIRLYFDDEPREINFRVSGIDETPDGNRLLGHQVVFGDERDLRPSARLIIPVETVTAVMVGGSVFGDRGLSK